MWPEPLRTSEEAPLVGGEGIRGGKGQDEVSLWMVKGSRL